MHLDLYLELLLETVLAKCNTHLFGTVSESENEVVLQEPWQPPNSGLAGRQGPRALTLPGASSPPALGAPAAETVSLELNQPFFLNLLLTELSFRGMGPISQLWTGILPTELCLPAATVFPSHCGSQHLPARVGQRDTLPHSPSLASVNAS